MTPEEMEMIMGQQAIAGAAGASAQVQAAQQYFMQEQEKSMSELQLEVGLILTNTYHKLRQDVLEPNSKGEMEWKPIPERERALTDWGVNRFMQLIEGYINKNTLLSNFDDKTIFRIMLQFTKSINGLMLMKYEFLFRQPTFEECKDILMQRIADKAKLKVFSAQILGQTLDTLKVQMDLLSEVESRIEMEIEKIRQEQRKQKLREYEVLLTQLDIQILSTLNRAWKGEERGSLRRHMNVSEVISKMPPQQNKGGFLGMFKA